MSTRLMPEGPTVSMRYSSWHVVLFSIRRSAGLSDDGMPVWALVGKLVCVLGRAIGTDDGGADGGVAMIGGGPGGMKSGSWAKAGFARETAQSTVVTTLNLARMATPGPVSLIPER